MILHIRLEGIRSHPIAPRSSICPHALRPTSSLCAVDQPARCNSSSSSLNNIATSLVPVARGWQFIYWHFPARGECYAPAQQRWTSYYLHGSSSSFSRTFSKDSRDGAFPIFVASPGAGGCVTRQDLPISRSDIQTGPDATGMILRYHGSPDKLSYKWRVDDPHHRRQRSPAALCGRGGAVDREYSVHRGIACAWSLDTDSSSKSPRTLDFAGATTTHRKRCGFYWGE